MHSLKTKIHVTNDEQNVNILTKVTVKRQVTGRWQMRAVLLKVWKDPCENAVKATDPLSKGTGTRTPIFACNFKVYELAQVYL